ncbi:MAG: O-antigen ligase family protein [Candidatus Aerophobetes bacterium]|nr:O-antigen ligase family protein [Candidatus Aerophobetes bacterium]
MNNKKIYGDVDSLLKICLVILFFLTPLVFYAWATTFGITKETFAELVILIMTVLWIIRLTETSQYQFLKSSLTLPILAFLMSLLISLLWTSDYYTSLLDFARWLGYILVYFIIISSLKEKRWAFAILFVSLLSAFLAASYSILQFYGIDIPIWRRLGGRTRLFSTFGNPNYLAGYLAACFPVAFILWIYLKDRLQRRILFFLMVTLYTSLLMTFTRGAWIALFLAGLFMLITLLIYQKIDLFRENRVRLLSLILALLIVTAIYSTPNSLNPKRKNVLQRGVSVSNLKQSSIQQRFLIWLSSVELVKQRPITGWGVGSFGLQYPFAQGKVLSQKGNRRYIPQANKSINAHNDYLHLTSETGIIGLVCFIWLIAVFYKRCFKSLRKMGKDGLLLIGGMGSVTVILAHSFFSFPFHIIQNGLIFYLMLGLGVGLTERRLSNRMASEGMKSSIRKKGKFIILRRAIQIGVVLAAVSLTIIRLRIFIADTHLKTAEMLMEVRAYPMALNELEKSIRIDPHNGLAACYLENVYTRLGRSNEAIDVFKKAKKNWVHPETYNNLGYAYLKMGQLSRAKESLKKGVFLFPNFSEAYFNLGYLSLLQAERNFSSGKAELVENKLNESLFYYEQGRVFKPAFSLPARLATSYQRFESNDEGEGKGDFRIREIVPPFPFYSQGNSPTIDFLTPIGTLHKPFYFRLFFYSPQTLTSPLDIALEVMGKEGGLIRKFTINKENILLNHPYLLRSPREKEILPGNYMVIARLRYGKGKLIMAKRKFSIFP